ncbi:pyruvate, phosphate dikinase [Rhabdothermincola salaria]|uniref:pyruvate, phosphate dikinase n=1 Tax=Rhabdothermincola salaria TaxID=2903142 RepID=UPI001E52CD49|nr:pyruvate, phosphate dikinase [Rhabdothermincola salaria]MCD9622389.1 pyruvate, phosphate dikinase [Rhabdothermincola salaria]
MTWVYGFAHRHSRAPRDLKALLGGKGANLAEMTSVLALPVPPGFTITTEACRAYMLGGWPGDLTAEIDGHVRSLERFMGRRLGATEDPLLVSVRSGAAFSMPGMMDTVLDLGLNDDSVMGLAAGTDERFALDSYRRFLAMYGRIVLDVPGEPFDDLLEQARIDEGVRTDAEVPAERLDELVGRYKELIEAHTGSPFPQDPHVQLRGAIEAVFRSWDSPRARAYRRREGIADDLGTAVNVQSMVFGNRDDQSGTGVAFTRDPSTGASGAYGDFLVNAQGEDVVAGIRTTLPLDSMADLFPAVHTELTFILERLERHYRDMLDCEFTIEHGRLWMLQTRVGKRTGAAALRIAVALTEDPTIRISRAEAVQRVRPEHLDQVLHPQLGDVKAPLLATGLPASPGAAVGHAYFDADRAVEAAERGERVVLVRQETSPEDVHGMAVAQGVLTSRGGLVSHAAVVARGWGKPAVCGAESLNIGPTSMTAADGTVVAEGDWISLDGARGTVFLGELSLKEGNVPGEFGIVLGWADEIRAGRLGVRANADTGPDAARARELGAEGIGLCRTEHMFLQEDRLPVVRRMILADDPDEELAALAELLDVQRADFEEVLEAMDGLPVTVRLLDPPLHEFLPSVEELIVLDARGELPPEGQAMLTAARHWQEQNPMLGLRGVRLGIAKAGLYRMQVRALVEAALRRQAVGGRPVIEIMIPLVINLPELDLTRRWVEEEVATVLAEHDGRLDVIIGSMIETPRAAIRADDIAQAADFFSFGTNDLTQMTLGFSRDDVAPILESYLEQGLLGVDPFKSVDQRGVGELVATAVERGRTTKPGLKMGVCGEHGGDPESIAFFFGLGLDYVSCSPFRVPVARLAAAHAVLGAGGGVAADA